MVPGLMMTNWLFSSTHSMESLPVRMDRHCENATKVSKFLENHKCVTWVNYPGLESHNEYELTKKLMNGKASSVLSFGIKGGMKKGGLFIDNLKLVTRLVNIGDAKSLACHPASTTHQQLSDEAQVSTGVTKDLIRLSVGLEDLEDLKSDLEEAFNI